MFPKTPEELLHGSLRRRPTCASVTSSRVLPLLDKLMALMPKDSVEEIEGEFVFIEGEYLNVFFEFTEAFLTGKDCGFGGTDLFLLFTVESEYDSRSVCYVWEMFEKPKSGLLSWLVLPA